MVSLSIFNVSYFIKEVNNPKAHFHQCYSCLQDKSFVFHRTLKLNLVISVVPLTIHLPHLHKLDRHPVCQYDALLSIVVTIAWSWTSLHSDELSSGFTPLLVVSVACSSLLVDLTDSDWSEEVGFCESAWVILLESYNQEIKRLNNKKHTSPFYPIRQYYKSTKKWF